MAHTAQSEAVLQSLIVGNKRNDETPLLWTAETERAFEQCK